MLPSWSCAVMRVVLGRTFWWDTGQNSIEGSAEATCKRSSWGSLRKSPRTVEAVGCLTRRGVSKKSSLCPCLLLLSSVSNGGLMAWVTDKALYVDSPRAIPAPLYELGLARASYVVCRFDSMTLRSMVADILCLLHPRRHESSGTHFKLSCVECSVRDDSPVPHQVECLSGRWSPIECCGWWSTGILVQVD